MKEIDIIQQIKLGEVSKVQFKERILDNYDIGCELVAFSNARGGTLVVGVKDKTGSVNPLSYQEVQETTNTLGNIASENVVPAILVDVETIPVDGGSLVVAHIKEGVNKPYHDNRGIVWVKNGADKRKVFDNAELAEMMTDCGSFSPDEAGVRDATIKDLDENTIKTFLSNKFEKVLARKGLVGDAFELHPKSFLSNFWGAFFMKYSYEQRLVIVQRVKKGEAIAHLSKEYHINETQILAWVRMWDKYGPTGLKKQPHCRPTPALKEKVVRLISEKGVPLAHVRIEYRIGKTALQRWVSIVRRYGYESLHLKKKRGRPTKNPMARPKKKEPQTELERLQAENLRLRAENALLKKVKALVEEQKARAILNGRKPSTN